MITKKTVDLLLFIFVSSAAASYAQDNDPVPSGVFFGDIRNLAIGAFNLKKDSYLFAIAKDDPGHLHRYAGTFYSRELNVTWRLAVVNQQLTLVQTPQIVLPIAGPLSPGMTDSTFHSLAGLLRFTNDVTGRVNGFGLSFHRMRDIRFERVGQHCASIALESNTPQKPEKVDCR